MQILKDPKLPLTFIEHSLEQVCSNYFFLSYFSATVLVNKTEWIQQVYWLNLSVDQISLTGSWARRAH